MDSPARAKVLRFFTSMNSNRFALGLVAIMSISPASNP